MKPGGEFGAPDAEQETQRNQRRYRSVVRLARVLLIVVLAAGGWAVYRELPQQKFASSQPTGVRMQMKTNLRIVLQASDAFSPESAAGAEVELHSVDTVAVEREYLSERRAGVRFDDFLRERTRSRPLVAGRFDERGEATLSAVPGRWWVHAHYEAAGAEWTWRIPINLAGREQQVELTPANAYTRTQSY